MLPSFNTESQPEMKFLMREVLEIYECKYTYVCEYIYIYVR
jgi:hypothetical protein